MSTESNIKRMREVIAFEEAGHYVKVRTDVLTLALDVIEATTAYSRMEAAWDRVIRALDAFEAAP